MPKRSHHRAKDGEVKEIGNDKPKPKIISVDKIKSIFKSKPKVVTADQDTDLLRMNKEFNNQVSSGITKKNIVYSGIRLSPKESEGLFRVVKMQTGLDPVGKEMGTHVTLQFRGRSQLVDVPKEIGKAKKIEVYAYYRDEDIDAVAVKIDGKTRNVNGTKYHITLSTKGDAQPKDTADLMEFDNMKTDLEPFDLRGAVGVLENFPVWRETK